MSKKKYYAVRIGAVPGIYTNWDDCRSNVVGYSGAEYKSFKSKAEAESFMNAFTIKKPDISNVYDRTRQSIKAQKEQQEKEYDRMDEKAIELSYGKNTVCVYTDGSWGTNSKGNKVYAGGFLILEKGEIVNRLCVSGEEKGLAELRNVAGEMQASVRGIDYVVNNMPHIRNVYMFVDYVGLIHWSIPANRGGWKRKNEYTKKYGSYVESMKRKLNIEFLHVKGHNKDPFNEEADRLASYAKELHLESKKFNMNTFIKKHSYIYNDYSG